MYPGAVADLIICIKTFDVAWRKTIRLMSHTVYIIVF